MNPFTIFADNTNLKSKSAKLRNIRFELFRNLLKIDNKSKILDVGGTEAIWINTGLEENVTLLNINHSNNKNSKFNYITGDACNMYMFNKNEFDVVFSNSVIEHVGDFH